MVTRLGLPPLVAYPVVIFYIRFFSGRTAPRF